MASKKHARKLKAAQRKNKKRELMRKKAAATRAITKSKVMQQELVNTIGDTAVAIHQVLNICNTMVDKFNKLINEANERISEGRDVEKCESIKLSAKEEVSKITYFIEKNIKPCMDQMEEIISMKDKLEQTQAMIEIQMKVIELMHSIPAIEELSLDDDDESSIVKDLAELNAEIKEVVEEENKELTLDLNNPPADLPEVKEFKKITEESDTSKEE